MALPDIFRPTRAIRRRPGEDLLYPLERMERDMRRMLEDFWMAPFGEAGRWGEAFIPSIDVKEQENDIVVSAELPGLDSKDVDVEVTQDSVRIAGEKKQEAEKEEKGYYRRESCSGSFERIIDLPTLVDEDKAEAQFSNGVLKITLPKSEQAKARRKKVQVKSA
jgi:HSP20 family protein